jgi:beta-glucosidase
LHEEYQVPRIIVTENGAATPDSEAPVLGQIDDTMRVDFFRGHLEEVARCRQAGVPVDTYFAWSLMDNFEWSEGYTLRYGICHVDFETQKRTPKASAHFLRSLRSEARQQGQPQ